MVIIQHGTCRIAAPAVSDQHHGDAGKAQIALDKIQCAVEILRRLCKAAAAAALTFSGAGAVIGKDAPAAVGKPEDILQIGFVAAADAV